MNILVLAGGTGTRLWPVSRILNPKQFTKFKGMGKSTFQINLEKISAKVPAKNIFIVTNKEYKYFVSGQLSEIGLSVPQGNIILEPSFKNTLHAVSAGMFHMLKCCDGETDVLVLPSNSVVADYSVLFDNISPVNTPLSYILTFGVEAAGAYIGRGYIKPAEDMSKGYCTVEKFVEKPSKKDAEAFVREGYLYNSGIIYCSINVFMDEFNKLEPDLYRLFMDGDLEKAYMSAENSTVEKSILERSKKVAVMSLGEKWTSINEFSNFYKQYDEKQDENGNISFNDSVFLNSTNNLIYSEGNKAVGVIGVDNLVVIDQPDALLVCSNRDTERVREIATIFKERGDTRADYHTTCYRPWGSYTVLEEGAGYKIKRITVLPGKKLSYQMHYHRSEHWVVVTGTAEIVKNDKSIVVRSGESIFLSVGEKHRLENPGKTLLEVIEVQIGVYLGEDDIVRFEDDFGRN